MGNRHAQGRDLVNPRVTPARDTEFVSGVLTYVPSFSPDVTISFVGVQGELQLALCERILPSLDGYSRENPPPEYSVAEETGRFVARLFAPDSPILAAFARFGPPALIRCEHGSAWGTGIEHGLMQALFARNLLPAFDYSIAARGRNKRCSIHEIAVPPNLASTPLPSRERQA